MGTSLIVRPAADAARRIADDARPLGLGDVAAAVQLGLIAPDDAGVIAEERGMSGGAIEPQQWAGLPEPALGAAAPYLAMRFGADPVSAWVKVDASRNFETGALIYANTAREWPGNAVGVITGPAPGGKAGGTALLSRQALETFDRFVIRTAHGAAPLRIAERLGDATPAG
jgi:sarcosine oxidase subunit alpha